MDYKNFKIDANNLNTLAPMLLKELEIGTFQHLLLDENEEITVVTKDLSGNERRTKTTIANVKAGLNNPKMNDIVISSTEMRFEY
jgi:hypothetical protein